MLKGLFSGLAKTRNALVGKIKGLFGGRKVDAGLLEELEEVLLTSDIGVKTTQNLIEKIQEYVKSDPGLEPSEALERAIMEVIEGAMVDTVSLDEKIANGSSPYVILVIGVNGVGKTTTIAKLARHFKQEGKKVLMVAADTYRAAAVEQLGIWAARVGVDIVKGQTGNDPSSVIFDSIQAGVARGSDIIIVDTAGRLHTKTNLMEELKKMERVSAKALAGSPHDVFLVLDATIGQNAISQARLFNKAVPITGLILTKVDSSSKGGVVLPILNEMKIPIHFLGIGEKDDDLISFNAVEFTKGLFG